MEGTVTIAGETRSLDGADENWINQQINRRNRDGISVCVVVSVKTSGVDVRLATPPCGNGGGGGRPPTSREQQVFELWGQHRLNTAEFSGGQLVAFLKQLRRLL